MPKNQRQWRILGSASFLLTAAAPLGALAIYLFAVTPALWRESLAYAFSSENEYRSLFILMTAAGLSSVAALAIIVVARRKSVLRGLLVAAVAQASAYLAYGAWFLALISIMPLWCAYMVQHEV